MSDIRARKAREARVQAQISLLVDGGRDFIVVLAHECRPDMLDVDDNPPFVQCAWRDDLRLQIETQGDQYRRTPYSHIQHRMLRNLGYHEPYALGDAFDNWTVIREAEGAHPASVARFMLQTLWLLHGVHLESEDISTANGVSYWKMHLRVSTTRRDIKAEILQRYHGQRPTHV